MRPFSEEEQADRRRPWRKREGLRRIAVLIATPTGVYALLILVSLLGGPRIGAPLLPLPNPRGVNAVSPVSGPPPSWQSSKDYPPIAPDTVTPPTSPVPVSPTQSPTQPTDPSTAKPTGPGSTTAQDRQTAGQAAARPTTGGRPPSTNPPQNPPQNPPTDPPTQPPSQPPTGPTPPPTSPPPTTPSEPPNHPQPPTLGDTIRALLRQLGL